MIEFLAYLDKIELEIVRLVKEVGYSIEENKPLCLLGKEYVGFLKKREKTIVICTDNAKQREGHKILSRKNDNSYERTAIHIKKALRHESTHVAQECNNGKLLKIKKHLSIKLKS